MGEEREFTVEYPEDHPDPERAGRRIGCRVRCKGLKVQVLPDLDDEFARGISNEPDLAGLRGKVEANLQASRRREADRALEQELLDAILGANPVPAPPTLVEEQAGESLRRVIESMVRQGIDPARVRVDWAEEQRKIREAADRQVRAGIVLDRIGEVEGIEVGEEEVERTLREMADQYI